MPPYTETSVEAAPPEAHTSSKGPVKVIEEGSVKNAGVFPVYWAMAKLAWR